MQSIHVLFNPFYQLVVILGFSLVRLFKTIYRGLIRDKNRGEITENPKFQLFWSICYVIFTLSVFYNFIFLLFSPLYARSSLLSMLLPISIVFVAAVRYCWLLVTEPKSLISILVVIITGVYELFALDVLIPYLGTYLSTFWIFLPLGGSLVIIFSKKENYTPVMEARKGYSFWNHWIWDGFFWGSALLILILQNMGLTLANL